MDTSNLTKENLQKWILRSAEGEVSIDDPFLLKRYKDIHPERAYYRFFYLLTEMLDPDLVVELGAWKGTGAAFFAAGNPNTKVLTIDHHTDPGDEEHKRDCLEVVSRYPNVEYLQGWTWDVAPQVPEQGKIDILFIDSWHVYDKAMRDWEIYSKMLSDKALVLCDDILDGEREGDPISGMKRFWEELPGQTKFLTRVLHMGFPMGVLIYEKTRL